MVHSPFKKSDYSIISYNKTLKSLLRDHNFPSVGRWPGCFLVGKGNYSKVLFIFFSLKCAFKLRTTNQHLSIKAAEAAITMTVHISFWHL